MDLTGQIAQANLGPYVPYSQRVADAVNSANGLAQAPSVVNDIANAGGDVAGTAQSTDLAAQQNALGEAVKSQKSSGWWGDITDAFHTVHSALNLIPGEKALEKDVIHPLAQTMGAPLREVQHEYRMLHDIYTRHGVVAGLGASLLTVAGGIGGGLLGGAQGAALGAEGATELDRLIPMFNDSYQRTTDGTTYRDIHGNPVSFGRDLAGLAFHNRNSEGYNLMSGGLDAAFDWFADPMMAGGNAFKAYRAGVTTPVSTLNDAEQALAAAHDGSNPQLANALDWLGRENNAGRIASRYPQLAPLAGQLARSGDAVEAGQVFLDQFRQANMLGAWNGVLPSRSALLSSVGDWRQAIKEHGQASNASNLGELQSLTPGQIQQGSLLSRVVEKVSNRQPTAVNEDLNKLSSTTFNPMSTAANKGVLMAARRVYGEKGAQDFLNLWTQAQSEDGAGLGTLKTLWENLNNHAFIRDGITDDATLRLLRPATKMLTKAPGEDMAGHYAFGVDGQDLSTVTMGDKSINIGLLENHVGQFTFPNFRAMGDALAALKNNQIEQGVGGTLLHTADHLANSRAVNTYIEKVFKPFAIGTSAAGMRVGMSEVLTYGLKNGFGSYLKALGAAMKGKEDAYQAALSDATPLKTVEIPDPERPGQTLTQRVPDQQQIAKNALATAWHNAGAQSVVSRFSKVLLRNEPDMADTARRLAEDGGIDNVHGHGAAPLDTAYGDHLSSADESVADVRNMIPKGKKLGPNMSVFHAAQADQPFAHRAALNEWLDPTGQAALRGADGALRGQGLKFGDAMTEAQRQEVLTLSAHAVENYLRSPEAADFVAKMSREHVVNPNLPGDAIYQWSHSVARAFEGITAYRNADNLVVHNPLFTKALAKGELPTIQSMIRNPAEMRPVMVKGRELVETGMGGGLQRLVNGTFDRFFAPWVRNLSRNPLYVAAVHDNYTRLKGLADGAIDDDQLWNTAKNHAITDIMPMLHNPMEKTQLEYGVKNIFPFMFAQRQQYQRYWHALAANPAGFRKAQLTQQALRSTGFIQKDANGQDTFVYPAAGHVSAAIAQGLSVFGVTPQALIPTSLTGQVQSLNPGAGALYPSLSPVLSIPMQELGKMFPNELGSLTAKVTASSANIPLWQQVLPFSPMRNAWRAYTGEPDAQFANSLMSVLAAAMAHDAEVLARNPKASAADLILPPEGSSPRQIQDARNHVKNWTRVHYAFMTLFGFFAPASPKATYGDTEIQQALAALRAAGSANGKTALENINAYVAAHPEALPYTVYKTFGLAGMPTPPAQEALTWVQNNQGFLTNHTYAAAALMPQLQGNNPDALALYQQQVQTGVRQFKTPEQFLNDLYIKEAAQPYFAMKDQHDKFQAAAQNNPQLAKLDQANWMQWEGNFFAQHPIFQQWVTSPDRELQRQQIVRDLESVFYSPQGDIAPDSPMKPGVKMLLDAYLQHESAQISLTGTGSTALKQADNANWNAFLQRTAQQQPMLGPLISHVFTYIKPDTVVDRPLLQKIGLVPA